MNQLVEEFVDHLKGAWRFRRASLAVAWLIGVVGWAAVLVAPNTYQAQAKVYVDTSTALRPLLQGIAVDQDIESQLNLVRETLLGRPQLERVARDADLDLKVKNADDRDAMITRFREQISIDAAAPGGKSEARRTTDSIYTITYKDRNRDKALTVVRSLLNSLVEDTLGGKRSGSDTAQKFLRDQIADYEKRLAASEESLAEFKKRNVGLVPGPGAQGDYFSRLQGEIAATRKSRTALDVALRRRQELERQARTGTQFLPGASLPGSSQRVGSDPGAPNSSIIGGNDTGSRIVAAQAHLDDLLLRFTVKHPEVIAARETLEELKAREAAQLEAVRRGDPGAAANLGLASNPVYQNIQTQLNQADVEIAAVRGELAEHERAEADLKLVANTAPEVEAEFARLNRDYDVTKAQYNSLLDRLEKAKLSDDAQQTGIVRFEIIDPPTSPLEPVAPKRPLLMTIVLLIAVGGAIGIAIFLSQLRPVFTNTRALTELTGLPVLGSVTMTWPERATSERRRGILLVAGGSGALIALFAIVVMLHESGARLLHQMFGLS